MSDVILVLGPVEFAQFEVPARIDFGGTQRLVVHDLPGAGRVVDLLGPAPSDIAWNGTFSGADAAGRAQVLDGLRIAGATLSLSWDVFLFSVVIRSFVAEYASTSWVPYRLICTVLQDGAQPAQDSAESFLATVLQDAASAANFCDLGGLDLALLQSSLGEPGATVPGTLAFAASNTLLAGSLAAAHVGRDTAGSLLMGYSESLGARDVAPMITQAGQAATLGAGAAYLSRAAGNLAEGES